MLSQMQSRYLFFEFINIDMFRWITGDQQFRIAGLSNQRKCLDQVVNALAGCQQSKK